MVSKDREKSLDKLSKRSEFLNVSKNGKRIYSGRFLLANYMPNEYGHLRCGWTIPKYVGTAVVRNRVRRWCREFFRAKLMTGWNPSIDVNIVLKRQEKSFYKNLDYSEFKSALEKLQLKMEKKS